MDLKDCIKFTNENPICYLATAEGDQPRVRALGFWFADETGFYFQTTSSKEFPHQLKLNPNTEICFYRHKDTIGTMLRISGKVEFLDDFELRKKAMNDRPFLKSFGLTVDSCRMIIFRITHGKAHFWTMDKNLAPKNYIDF